MLTAFYIACLFTGIVGIADNRGVAESVPHAALNAVFVFMTVFGFLGVFITAYHSLTS